MEIISEASNTQLWLPSSSIPAPYQKQSIPGLAREAFNKAEEFSFTNDPDFHKLVTVDGFSDKETDLSTQTDPIEELLVFSQPDSKPSKLPESGLVNSRAFKSDLESLEMSLENSQAEDLEEEYVEVDMAFFRKYEDFGTTKPEDSNPKLKKKKTTKKKSGFIQENIDIQKNFQTPPEEGTHIDFPLAFTKPTSETESGLALKKNIQKKKTSNKFQSSVQKKLHLSKKTLQRRIMIAKEFKKKNPSSDLLKKLSTCMLKSKKLNKEGGKEMNNLLYRHMLCAREEAKNEIFEDMKVKLIAEKRLKMLRVLEKRERIHQHLEKVFHK